MNIKQILLQEIESSSDVLLAETLDFLRFLKTKPRTEQISLDLSTEKNDDTSNHQTKPEIQEATPILRGSKAEDLLKFAGTWQGDDFEECLQLVYQTRSQSSDTAVPLICSQKFCNKLAVLIVHWQVQILPDAAP